MEESKFYNEMDQKRDQLPIQVVDEKSETLKYSLREKYRNLEENSRKISRLRDHLEMT